MSTGDMRMSDIHNRRFVIGTNSSGIFLWLAPYRTNATGTGSFGSYLTSHFGDNFGRRSSQVAERLSLELDFNLIGLHLERAAQE